MDGAEDLERCTGIGLGYYLKMGRLEVDAIVLCPQCPTDRVWNNVVTELKSLVDRVTADFSVNPKKITVTGMSMGGFGTWEMGVSCPEAFAAIAPVCGGGMAWRTDRLKGMPIWVFHGDADTRVNISNSVEMVDAARKNGADVRFTVFSGVEHNSWDPAYLETNLIEWLLKQELK